MERKNNTLTEGELKELGSLPSQLQTGEQIAWCHEITKEQLSLQKRVGGSQIFIGPLLMGVSILGFWANVQQLIRLTISGYGAFSMFFVLGLGLFITGIQSRKAVKVNRSVLIITNKRILRFSARLNLQNGENGAEIWTQDSATSRYDIDAIRVHTRGEKQGEPVAIADLILLRQVADQVIPTPYTDIKDIEGALNALEQLRPSLPMEWKTKAWNSFTQS
jgi:hypothetical protein